MKKNTKTKKKGGSFNYNNLVSLMNKLKNDVRLLGEIIQKIRSENNVSSEIPVNIQEKIEEQTEELNKVIEKIDEQEQKIEENPNKIEVSNDNSELDEDKEDLVKDINLLEEKISEGLPQERNRSFYLPGRTWNQWFYGFVEYYSELKDSLTNILNNNYYISILQKPKNERSNSENQMISKINNIEIELSKMNNNIIKGGFNGKTRNNRSKK